MKTDKPFVLAIHIDSRNSFGSYVEEKVFSKSYATKQGLMQGAHYWANYYQHIGEYPLSLWRGGYYSNYILTLHGDSSLFILHAFEVKGYRTGTTVAVDLTSIVSRAGLGEDVRGESYKTVSSSKVSA